MTDRDGPPPGRPGNPGWSALDRIARSPADYRVTAVHIGRWNLIRLGARDLVHDDRRGALWYRVGPRRPHRKMLVVLRSDDLYAVEVGRLVTVGFLPSWVSEATVGVDHGLYADQLGDAVTRLYEVAAG